MKQKAHRFKRHYKTEKEVLDEFYQELYNAINDRIMAEMGPGPTIIAYQEYRDAHFERLRIEEKINLIDHWEKSGRKVPKTGETYQQLLILKYLKSKS